MQIKFSSKEGQQLLAHSTQANDFWSLSNAFQPQINPAYCGVASAVIVANALYSQTNTLPVQKKLSLAFESNGQPQTAAFYGFSQLTLITDEIAEIKTADVICARKPLKNGIYSPGLSMNELVRILQAMQLDSSASYYGVNSRRTLKDCLAQLQLVLLATNAYLIANFDGRELGCTTRGHFSPIAAIDDTLQYVLILDTAFHKQAWFWSPIETFYRGLCTTDQENQDRGLIIARRLRTT
jgi:hypothetical protein